MRPGCKTDLGDHHAVKSFSEVAAGQSDQATDERIAARNTIALKIVQAKGIPVDDLNALVRGHPEYHSDNVHFNAGGIDLEAAQVAAQIEPLLKN